MKGPAASDDKGTPRDLWKIAAFWVVVALALFLYALMGLRGMIQQHIERAAPAELTQPAKPR